MNDKAGRNDPCPCGSGRKYKRCCLRQDQAAESAVRAAASAAAAGHGTDPHHHDHEACGCEGHRERPR